MEVVTVSVSRHGKHDEEVYQAMQEVWKEISRVRNDLNGRLDVYRDPRARDQANG